jgi:hypothetical protein
MIMNIIPNYGTINLKTQSSFYGDLTGDNRDYIGSNSIRETFGSQIHRTRTASWLTRHDQQQKKS